MRSSVQISQYLAHFTERVVRVASRNSYAMTILVLLFGAILGSAAFAIFLWWLPSGVIGSKGSQATLAIAVAAGFLSVGIQAVLSGFAFSLAHRSQARWPLGELGRDAKGAGVVNIYSSRKECSQAMLRQMRGAVQRIYISGDMTPHPSWVEAIEDKACDDVSHQIDIRMLVFDPLRSPAIVRSLQERAEVWHPVLSVDANGKQGHSDEPGIGEKISRVTPRGVREYRLSDVVSTWWQSAVHLVHQKPALRSAVRLHSADPMAWMVIVDSTAYLQLHTYAGNEMPVISFEIDEEQLAAEENISQSGALLVVHFRKMWAMVETDMFRSEMRHEKDDFAVNDLVLRNRRWMKHAYRNNHEYTFGREDGMGNRSKWQTGPLCVNSRRVLRHDATSNRHISSIEIALEVDGQADPVKGRLIEYSENGIAVEINESLMPGCSELCRVRWIAVSPTDADADADSERFDAVQKEYNWLHAQLGESLVLRRIGDHANKDGMRRYAFHSTIVGPDREDGAGKPDLPQGPLRQSPETTS